MAGNLPSPLSSFIGRERELDEIRRQLSTHRLLTLTGPGGVGKTRLAIEAARGLNAGFPEGISLVELAALADPALVPQTAAAAVGVQESGGRSLADSLAAFLSNRRLLLVLDNCEHLVLACARLAGELLAACPDLCILATSREPLGTPGETVWSVPPLSMPGLQPWSSPDKPAAALPVYLESEAVRLFVARAGSNSSGFVLTETNAAWVADICRRLDGLPLAIELAAARTNALSVREIAGRLDDRFRLLTGGSRIAPPRHQALAATIDWSYSLLGEGEKTVLERLSVFAGGCTLQAAEAVCSSAALPPEEVLDALSQLIDKSLLSASSPAHTSAGEADGGSRYGQLETIRQYSREKLAETGHAAQARDRHLAYFVAWAAAAEAEFAGPEVSVSLNRFEIEHDNLRAAFDWSLESGQSSAGLRLAVACGRFWIGRGYLSEGRRLLGRVISMAALDETPLLELLAQADLIAANLAYLQSDYMATRSYCEDSLALFRKLGPGGRAGVAQALSLLGEAATEQGDYTNGPRLFEEALEIDRELGNLRGIGNELMQLGWAALRTGDPDRAVALLEESLAKFTELGEPRQLGFNLAGLGEAAVRQGDLTRGTRFLDQSLALRRQLGDRWGIGATLGTLGWVALRRRDFNRMRAALGESLAVRQEIGDQGGIAWCLEKLAEGAVLQGRPLHSAGRLDAYRRGVGSYAAASVLRHSVRSVVDPADQPEQERMLAELRAALGDPAFSDAWREGAGAPLPVAIAAALAALTETRASGKEAWGGLSPREAETAALVAQGKTNQQIADALTVRVKTVETYITRILNKLGFDSRVQIAAWVIENGLQTPGTPRIVE